MRTVTVTLIGKPDCHLCDDAREVLRGSREALAARGILTVFEEHNMLTDPSLERAYQEDIPVVLIDGKRHSFWRVDATRFEAAVEKRAQASSLKRVFQRKERP